MIATVTGIHIEGNLITPDITEALKTEAIKGQSEGDFGLSKVRKLEDEIAMAWDDAKAYWTVFQRRLIRLESSDTGTSVTREHWVVPILEILGYKPGLKKEAENIDGQSFFISHGTEEGENKPPLHIIGCRIPLDKKPPSGMPRLSAHGLMQEYQRSH